MESCANCSKPLPIVGYFCSACLTQYKCKECDSPLEIDYAGCISCGTQRVQKSNTTDFSQHTNTFKVHETLTERTIEATFSDAVGKDLSSILRDAYASRTKRIEGNDNFQHVNNTKEGNKEEFGQVKVLDSTLSNVNNQEPKLQSQNSSANNEYPTLRAIGMKNLPSSETEWVVVYAFYASNFGSETFTRQNIIEKYKESNRLDNDKKVILSSRIARAVQGGYLNPLANDYSILEKGIEKAIEIINRSSSSSPRVKTSSKKTKVKPEEGSSKVAKTQKTSVSGKSPKRLTDIDFHPAGKDSLISFLKKFAIKNDNERNLVFVHYLSEILKIGGITQDHLYTCYDEVNSRIPENLNTSLNNTKFRTGWLGSDSSGIIVTTKGRNKIKLWDKNE
jgi:hypothetical protein